MSKREEEEEVERRVVEDDVLRLTSLDPRVDGSIPLLSHSSRRVKVMTNATMATLRSSSEDNSRVEAFPMSTNSLVYERTSWN